MRLWIWGPVVALSVLVTAVSSIPARSMPPGDFWRFDKLLHAGEYAALGLVWCRAFVLSGAGRVAAAALAVTCAGCYGVFDELYQTLIPGRHSSVFDAMADFAGACAGALAYVAITREKNNAGNA